MLEILSNDSTKTFKPIIYQFYIALEKCFDLRKDEKLYIETYGDVTIANKVQIEVKDYNSELTDLDHNIWKTLKNWLHVDFDISSYKNLVLLTTQILSENTSFQNWNENNKNEKLNILESIAKNYNNKKVKSSKTVDFIEVVLLDSTKDKLINILEKFIIDSAYSNDEDLYQQLIETRISGAIPNNKKEIVLDSLFGLIINPISSSNGWKISYETFRQREKVLIEQYNSQSIVFPAKLPTINITPDENLQHKNELFIEKINDIKYEKVKNKAIEDYIKTNIMITHDLSKRLIDKEYFKAYESELKDIYEPSYSIHSRNTDTQNCIKHSKTFYDEIMKEESPNLFNFGNTPRYFKNGTLHNLADDPLENITWKLEVEEDE